MTDTQQRQPTISEQVGIAWYNRLTPVERQYWHEIAGSPRPVDAFLAYSNHEEF